MVKPVDTRTLPDGKTQTGSACRGLQAGKNSTDAYVHPMRQPVPVNMIAQIPAPTRLASEKSGNNSGFVPDAAHVQNRSHGRALKSASKPNLIDDPAVAVGLAIWQARLARVTGAPFPQVIRDLLLCHAIEGNAACEMMLACLGLPETEHEGASPKRFSTGFQLLLEGDRS